MGLLSFLIIVFIIGLFVGGLARLLVPGPDPMGLGQTALIGIAGSLLAGLFSWYVLHRHGAGLLLSLIFSMILVGLQRRSRAGYRPTGGMRGAGMRRW